MSDADYLRDASERLRAAPAPPPSPPDYLGQLHQAENAKLYNGSSAAERAADWFHEANEWRQSHNLATLPFPAALDDRSRYDCDQCNPPESSDGNCKGSCEASRRLGGVTSDCDGEVERDGQVDRDQSRATTRGSSTVRGRIGDPARNLRGRDAATQHGNPGLARHDWEPSQPAPERAIRRRMWRLRYYLRHIARDRIKACGFALTATGGGVGVAVKPEGGAYFQGLQTCASVWECPPCQMTIKGRRADEIRRVVEKHSHARAAMLSLTIRHGRGDDLSAMRKDLANAWRGFARGAAWRRFRERHRVIGWVRSLEITHSDANGWHPHIHVLLLFADELPRTEVYEIDGVVRWVPRDLGWVIDRWQSMVSRYIGEAHEPDDDHGAVLSPCFAADYISKLGLEMSDPGAKRGRHKGRTPLQIASDYADASQAVKAGRSSLRRRKARDGWLWTQYCEAMRGARQLTWSRGLKAQFGIVERTDAEVSQEEEPACDDQAIVVGVIGAEAWNTIRCRRVGTCSAAYHLLRAAESGGGPGLRKAVAEILSGGHGVVGA